MNNKLNIMENAELHYRKGDFKLARKASKAILSNDDVSDNHKMRAKKILKATGIDPAAKVVFTLTAILLFWLVFRYIVH